MPETITVKSTYGWVCPICKQENTEDTRKSFVICEGCGTGYDTMPITVVRKDEDIR